MKFTVYHAKEPTFSDSKPVEFTPANFDEVAMVDTNDLDEVYRLTNHITHNWTLNQGVVSFNSGGVRSTSVGDVVTDGAGCRFRYKLVGWEKF